MVVDNLDILCIAVLPPKTNAPLIIDANAPLTRPIAGKLFKTVTGRNSQKVQRCSTMYLLQLSLSDTLHILRQLFGKLSLKKLLRFLTSKASNHEK